MQQQQQKSNSSRILHSFEKSVWLLHLSIQVHLQIFDLKFDNLYSILQKKEKENETTNIQLNFILQSSGIQC